MKCVSFYECSMHTERVTLTVCTKYCRASKFEQCVVFIERCVESLVTLMCMPHNG